MQCEGPADGRVRDTFRELFGTVEVFVEGGAVGPLAGNKERGGMGPVLHRGLTEIVGDRTRLADPGGLHGQGRRMGDREDG